MVLQRELLLADESLKGAAWCRAHSDLVDAWLEELLDNACDSGDTRGLALVAVGGYGRSELCPGSDIDVLLVHDRVRDLRSIADRIWYPVWDQGLKLGQSVASVKEVLSLADEDLDTATALLSARHVAGDASLSAQLAVAAGAQWERRSKRWLSQLADRTEERHARFGEVAFRLEPDLKEGRGGLRDVHALGWAEASHRVLLEHDATAISRAYSVVLDARVELQRLTGRPNNVLALQEQPAVAQALGDGDADTMMTRVAEAARLISWTSDDAWRRIRSNLRGRVSRSAGRPLQLGEGLVLKDGEVELAASTAPSTPLLALKAALAAARRKTVIERNSLEKLVSQQAPVPEPWPAELRKLFVDLLLTGAPAIAVIESLDQRGLWTRLLPEWQPVQARPQHNAYHLFTVDRHLLETAARASALRTRVGRPDLLVVAAVLHDVGKGYPGDHSQAGADLIRTMTARMGFPPSDVETFAALVRYHLLLPDAATRRDLDDPGTLQTVASTVATRERLHLLWALTEADSLATGPSAWSPWKASLVAELVNRVDKVMQGTPADAFVGEAFPSGEQLRILGSGENRIEAGDGVVTVYAGDRPGTFSRVAGVLALHGLDVLSANAYSSEDGRALSQFRVMDPRRDVTPWDRVRRDLELALDGGLAVQARLAERARTYGRAKPTTRNPVEVSVRFDNSTSHYATVVEVHAPDGIGVLYRITRALADLDLDIRSAKVQTLGGKVVDSFYLRGRDGGKITDRYTLGELEKAILHSVEP
ncbi:MAG TPA: [protein-PII] uridylyltransferase [Actinomycetota bacterium]|nr:[protein-PII] uridylyltransferase [Actinomycetota bacterium]